MGWPDLASRALKTVRWTVFTRRDVGRRARAVQIRPMFSRRRLLQIKRCNPLRGCILVGPAGFEPTQWRSQSPLPYRLATAQQKKRPRSIITVRSLVGCLERFELSASRATIWRANQLRHRHHRMRPKGLEPLAHCLEGSCSIVIILRNFSFKLQRYNNLGTDYMDFTVFNERTMHSVQSVPKIQMNQILYSSYIFSISAA